MSSALRIDTRLTPVLLPPIDPKICFEKFDLFSGVLEGISNTYGAKLDAAKIVFLSDSLHSDEFQARIRQIFLSQVMKDGDYLLLEAHSFLKPVPSFNFKDKKLQ